MTDDDAVRRWLEAHPREAPALVAAQERDARRTRLRARRREVRAADLGPDELGQAVLDCGPDRKPSTLVGISMTWDARHARYRPRVQRCPACGDRIRRDRHHYCLCCSASSKDPKQHPAQEEPREPTKSTLAGGRGRCRASARSASSA